MGRPSSNPAPTPHQHLPLSVPPCRGEIVENVPAPLSLDTKLLLVKPPVGLSTPEIFKALDLGKRSEADPKALLRAMRLRGAQQELCVNDLEQPAFDRWGCRVAAGLFPPCLRV